MKTGWLRPESVKKIIESAHWWFSKLAVEGAGRVAVGEVGLLPQEAAELGETLPAGLPETGLHLSPLLPATRGHGDIALARRWDRAQPLPGWAREGEEEKARASGRLLLRTPNVGR
ncbi:hypothetical protein PAL_GLEAN10005450 [Pteropus alecto]|uniref:Uncharacterized protein n=1 Tax=Pteropus alecto TaxID=9402 RepID=L5JWF4_PTEAL|nr:hypothetical protein PAL_GLEAN10005450 [Pteropus alecto]